MEFSEEQEYCVSAVRIVDRSGKSISKSDIDLQGMFPNMSQMLDQSFKTVLATVSKFMDNTWGVAMKTIGECNGANNAIRVAVGVEPWSLTFSNPNSTVHLNSGQRLDVALDMARSAVIGGVLSTASHLSDFGNSTSNIFGLTKTLETGVANGNIWSLSEKGYNLFNTAQSFQETFKGFEIHNKSMPQ